MPENKTFDLIKAELSAEAGSEFEKAVNKLGFKLGNLATGEYTDKNKADSERREVENKLKEAQTQIAAQSEAIKKAEAAGASLEELKAKLAETETSYQQKLTEVEKQAARERQAGVIKDHLVKAGCKDTDYALFKLNQKGALDKLEFKENGEVLGLTDHVKELQTANPAIWDVKQPQGTHVPSDPKKTLEGDAGITNEQWAALNLDPPK